VASKQFDSFHLSAVYASPGSWSVRVDTSRKVPRRSLGAAMGLAAIEADNGLATRRDDLVVKMFDGGGDLIIALSLL
jgi:hypothetical protein